MEVRGCSASVLEQVLNYMYGEDIACGFGDCAGVLEMAERWLMADLKRHVSLRIAEDLNRITYVEISQLAEKYSTRGLAERCAEFIVFEARRIHWPALQQLPMVRGCRMQCASQCR